MFCGNCGQQLKDDAKFCHGCGSPVGTAETPVQSGSGTGVGGGTTATRQVRKKKKNLIWIPIAAAALVLVVLVGVLAGGLLGSDSAKLVKAITKSANAYTDAADKMGVPDLNFIADKKAYSTDVAFTIDEVEGSTEMAGMGVRMSVDASIPKRELGVSMTPFFGAADILTAQVKIDNEKFYVGVPELTGDTFYMINTETLGQDLNNLGAGVPELDAFGFNLFDIVEQIEKINVQNEQAGEEMKKAFLVFAETIEVEKTGTEEIEINGSDLKCTVYEVVISEDALNNLVDAIEDSYKDIDNTEAYLDIFESMGLPAEAIAELEYELEYAAGDTDEVFDGVREVLDVLRDVQLEVYVNDGYVVGAVYEERIQGTSVEIILNLGGGENYVDDLSLRMIVDGNEVCVTSTGNHAGEDGEYIDETMVEVIEDGYAYTVLAILTSYEPKAKEDNFKMSMNADGVEMYIRGQVETGSDSISMALDEVRISEYGYNLMTIGVEYQIGQYESSSINTRSSIPLANLNEDQLMNEVAKIEENAMGWAEDLMNQFPELMYYLY